MSESAGTSAVAHASLIVAEWRHFCNRIQFSLRARGKVLKKLQALLHLNLLF
jgi:hypothetical protein